MLKDSKTPIIIGCSIPLAGYLSWLLFFSQHYPDLKELADKNAILHFVILSSAIVAVISLISHVAFALIYTHKLATALIEIENLNERIQGLTEDLSEIATYNQDQITEAISQIKLNDPCSQRTQPTLSLLNEAAEEMSLRTDKTAIEIQRLDKSIKKFFVKDRNPKFRSKLTRKWESAYFFR